QVVSWYLRNDARERSARLIQFALDPDVAKYLQKSTEAEAKVPEESKEKLVAALKRVHAGMPKEAQFDAVFAVDQEGRVVAHLGYDQAAGMEDFELGGYPVVADALHGYVRDDTLVLDRIYRVVARPVEFELGSAPAGAIVGARIIDDRFARELSSRTGAAVAFYVYGQRTASGAPEGFDTSQLDQIMGDLGDVNKDEEYREKGRSKVRVIGTLLSVQYTKLPGEAWQLGAGYAVARLPVHVDNPLGFFKTADDKDKAQANLLLAIMLALVAAAAGILFSVVEHTVPLRIFKREAERFAKGDADNFVPSKFRGMYRKIASDVNDGIDQQLAKGGGPRRGPADFKEVLGDIPDQPQMSAFSIPGDNPTASPEPVPASAPSRASPEPPQQKSLPQPPAGRRAKPPPPRGAVAAPNPGESPAAAAPEDGAGEEPLGGWGAGATDESEWRGVYQDFVALKQQCGENTEGFTYEKFELTLRKNRETLINRHGAKRVKFSVYIKDGKAALKAAPLKD
ncbi:MAG TPA: MXAN_5187 family protein, partial [Polyangiaceae bacterium]|nr:MXAN_5187 family protein [Polyangiaceae bacterium]